MSQEQTQGQNLRVDDITAPLDEMSAHSVQGGKVLMQDFHFVVAPQNADLQAGKVQMQDFH